MSIVIINWLDGENNPFDYLNENLKRAIEEQGRTVRIINLGDNFLPQLKEEHAKGIEFVFTWQGLGSGIRADVSKPSTIWEELKIPLLCYHGDHPCHKHSNHNPSSPMVRHIYPVRSFYLFANKYIKRNHAAIYLEMPIFFEDSIKSQIGGNYFVLPKNFDDNTDLFNSWNDTPNRKTAAFLLNTADEIINEFGRGNVNQHHAIIEEQFTPTAIKSIQQEIGNYSEHAIRWRFHTLLDKVYRNIVSEYILMELEDMPIKIYGRGWERYKAIGNPNHEFLAAPSVSDCSFQYLSNYGILDVAAINDSLHDRTFRAMANQSSFLIGSKWAQFSLAEKDFSAMFFDGTPGDLHSKAAQVIKSPELHRQQCKDFALQHRTAFPFSTFLNNLVAIADSVG